MAKLVGGTRIYGNALIDGGLGVGNISVANTTASTSTTTGALTVAGGVGIVGDIHLGGELNIDFRGGDEGGQVTLAGAVTNTTLVGNVAIDIYQNKLRIFEKAGTNRGVFVDLSSAAASVGTDLLIGGGGSSGYSNVNVAAYTQAMGYTNYSNVNVAAYVTAMGVTNYSNINVIAYLAGGITSTGFINTSGNISAGGNVTVANLIVPVGSGQFSGQFNESIATAGVFIGNAGTSGGITPRIGFFNGVSTQNWQIDNAVGTFRWFTPGTVRMSLNPNGNLILPSGNVYFTSNASVTSNAAELVLGQTGDQFGPTYLRMQNRTGLNGAVFDGASSTQALVDFGFKTANSQKNIRFETRSGQNKLTGGDGFEFQIGYPGAPQLVVGNIGIYVPNTTVSSSTTTGAIVTAGGAGISGNINAGTVGAISGQFHTIVGNLTQTTSGGSVYFNTTGNVLASQFVGSGSLLTALPGYAYSNVNVAAYVTSMGVTNYSNVNVIAYLAGGITSTGFINTSGNVSAAVYTGAQVLVSGLINTAGNVLASQFVGSGSLLTALPGYAYSNVNVAAYVTSMGHTNYSNVNVIAYLAGGVTSTGFINTSGNVSAAQFVGSGSLLTALPGYAYSNVNVAAYVTSMGVTNFSNVNVAAYGQAMGFQNFGNVNVAAYVTSMGHTNYGNVNVIAYLAGGITSTGFINTSGNVSAATGSFGAVNSTGFINTSGNVSAAVHSGGQVAVTGLINTSGNVSAAVHSGGQVAVTGLINTAGNILALTGNLSQLGVTTNVTAGGFINASGNILGATGTFGTLNVNGAFSAITKSFLIDHPSKPNMKLRYGSLEGPENGVYVRGRLTDNNIIKLPDYWVYLIDPSSITVNLTPIGSHQKLYVQDISNNAVTVGNDNLLSKSVNCFYTVWAERADVDKLVVETTK